MVYQWKPAARIKCDAQVAGEFCESLERTIGLTAKNLLDASRDEDAPLHSEFEWNDTVAAEAYREVQAMNIIRMICIAPEKEEKEPTRAFFKISVPRTYEGTHIILKNADKRSALLDVALKELEAFRRKYAMLSELAHVFASIDEVTDKQG